MARTRFTAVTFNVRGQGQFPTDMLRYDRCVPNSQTSVADMESTCTREVSLIMYTNTEQLESPTVARWNSFGWEVDLSSICEVD